MKDNGWTPGADDCAKLALRFVLTPRDLDVLAGVLLAVFSPSGSPLIILPLPSPAPPNPTGAMPVGDRLYTTFPVLILASLAWFSKSP